jgi:PAS domain S-box-containing protein
MKSKSISLTISFDGDVPVISSSDAISWSNSGAVVATGPQQFEFQLTPDFRFLDATEGFAMWLGRTLAELSILSFVDFLPTNDQLKVLSAIGRIAAGDAITGMNIDLQQMGGSTVPVFLDLAPVYEGQRFSAIAVIVRLIPMETSAHHQGSLTHGFESTALVEEIERLERQLETTVHNAPVGICVTDSHGIFTSVNAAYCEIYDYEPEEMLNQHFTMVVPKETEDIWREKHRRFIDGRDAVRGEFNVVRKGGELITILTDSARVVEKNGNIYKITYVQDISEIKRQQQQMAELLAEVKAQEEELRQNAEELESSREDLRRSNLILDGQFKAINQAFFVAEYDLNGYCMMANSAWQQFSSLNQQQFYQTPVQELLQSHASTENIATRWLGIKSGWSIDGDFCLSPKPNTWIHATFTPIIGTDGTPYKVFMIGRDITNQLSIESLIRKSEEQLSSIIRNAPVAIAICNEMGVIQSINDRYTEIFQYKADELVGKHFTAILPVNEAPTHLAAFQSVLDGKSVPRREIVGLTKSGFSRNLLADWTLIVDSEGHVRVVSFWIDVTDQKENEAQLSLLSLVASKTDNAVIITDRNGLIEWVNDGFVRVSGYELAEVKGRKPGNVLQGPGTNPATVQRIREGLASKQSFVVEILNYHKDKTPYWLELNISPILDESNDVSRFVAIERDITQARADKEQVQLLSLVASKTDNAVIITDKYGLIQWVNEGFTRIAGYRLDEVAGKKPGQVLQGAATDKDTVARIRQHLLSGASFQEEILNYHKDGTTYWINLAISPVYNALGELERYVAIETDITTARAQRDRLQQLSLVASKTDNAVIITDSHGAIQWVNEGFTRIAGFEMAEVLGKKPGSVLQGPDTDPKAVANIREKLQQKVSFHEEILNYTKSGVPYWLSLSITPIFDEQQKLIHFIAIESDITQRKAQEQALVEANDQIRTAYEELTRTQDQLVLSEKMASLGQLIAGIAHEVNTPISAVKASARNINRILPEVMGGLPQLLLEVPDSDITNLMNLIQRAVTAESTISTKEERQAKKTMTAKLNESGIENADDIASTLVEIRIFDNIEQFLPLFKGPMGMRILTMVYNLGQIKVNMGSISIASDKTAKIVTALKSYSYVQSADKMVSSRIHESIDTVLTLYSNQLKRGIQISRQYDFTEPILCYPDELSQVWTNIIQNAIYAMDGLGTLSISVSRSDQSVVVTIGDTGPGIPTTILHRIFEPFFTTKPQGEGTGLGLDIVKKIIEKHKGEISVQSQPGSTVFTVQLPARVNETVLELP